MAMAAQMLFTNATKCVFLDVMESQPASATYSFGPTLITIRIRNECVWPSAVFTSRPCAVSTPNSCDTPNNQPTLWGWVLPPMVTLGMKGIRGGARCDTTGTTLLMQFVWTPTLGQIVLKCFERVHHSHSASSKVGTYPPFPVQKINQWWVSVRFDTSRLRTKKHKTSLSQNISAYPKMGWFPTTNNRNIEIKEIFPLLISGEGVGDFVEKRDLQNTGSSKRAPPSVLQNESL